MNLKFNITLSKSQRKAYELLHQDNTQYLICNWSRQCGKTTFAEISLIEYLCKSHTFNAYISPSYSQGRKVYSELIKLLDGKNIIKKANASTLTIETVFKSTLQFFSLESPTAIRGYTIKGILVLDEASFFPDSLTDGSEPFSSIIMPITKAAKPKVLVISTPKGKRGMFYNLYNKALLKEEGFEYIKATIYDDNLVSQEEIDNIKTLVNPIAFREEFECEFLDSSLTFFNGFEDCFKEYDYNDTIKQYIGIDLSSTQGNDNTILTKINDKSQTISIPIQGTLTQKYNTIAKIINETDNLQTVYIEENGIGLPMIEEIKKLVNNKNIIKNWLTNNTSKVDILSNLAVAISDKKICFQKEDTKLFSEFGTFIQKYTKHGNVQLEATQGHHDDRIMSMAIALRAKQDKTKMGAYALQFNRKQNKEIDRLRDKYENTFTIF